MKTKIEREQLNNYQLKIYILQEASNWKSKNINRKLLYWALRNWSRFWFRYLDRKLQCYLFWYDNHKGWKCLSTTTINRVDSVGWKHLRWFYLAPLRGCATFQQKNRNWGRAWLVNAKRSTPKKKFLPGTFFSHTFSLQLTRKQQLWWHHWLGNITRIKISLKRNSFILYLPRNLAQKVLRCGVLIWTFVVRGTKHRETTSIWFTMP